MQTPSLSEIRIYPVKGLDPVLLGEVTLGNHSLQDDRRFAMVSDDGAFINGKRTGRVNQLKAEYDLKNRHVTLSKRGSDDRHKFDLHEDNKQLLSYLRDFFETRVSLVSSENGDLMDVPKKGSISIVGTGSFESLMQDIPDVSLDDLRLRFRSNLEITGVPPYWEEQLFAEPGTGIRFMIGDVELVGIRPRIRCSVPPRNPLNGETDKSFGKAMLNSRLNSLPEYSNLLLHTENMYYFAVDCFSSKEQAGKKLHVGDELKILGSISVSGWFK